MSWVLILTPLRQGDRPMWPAVVGGYPTREQAEAAGRVATAADDDEYGQAWCVRGYDAYAVIPGAADTAPEPAA